VRLTLEPRAFEHWDDTTHRWMLEPGEFQVYVGTSSRDLLQSTTITF
jgi:beta-glucosidase